MKMNREIEGQLLYFTSTSLLAGDTGLLFLRDEGGSPNLFYKDFYSNGIYQLTQNREGVLKSYVYFTGTPYRGFGKASVTLDPRRGCAYYLWGQEICCVDIKGNNRVLAKYPRDQITGFTHLSPDGSLLCVPTVDGRALDGDLQLFKQPKYNIDRRIREEKLNSYLRIYDTITGDEIRTEKIPCAWVTHVQFSPIDPTIILYNNEWPSDCGIRRMWIWNGKKHIRLRPFGRRDWVCHEMWEREGQGIIYHGKYHKGPSFIGRYDVQDETLTEIPLPGGVSGYGHFTTGRKGILVSDGYFKPNDSYRCDQWISLQRVNWIEKEIEWLPICKHHSNWKSQDDHPHPILNHRGDRVYFNSRRLKKRIIREERV